MCIIVENSIGAKIDDHIVDNCVTINDDGYAIFFLDTGELIKTMDKGKMSVLMSEARPYVAHCRYATLGATCEENIHLFEFENYLFAMNGTVSGWKDEKANDTRQLLEIVKLLPKNKVTDVLSMFKARFLIVNRETKKFYRTGDWIEHKGVCYSKDNVLKKKKYSSTQYQGQGQWPSQHQNQYGEEVKKSTSQRTEGSGKASKIGSEWEGLQDYSKYDNDSGNSTGGRRSYEDKLRTKRGMWKFNGNGNWIWREFKPRKTEQTEIQTETTKTTEEQKKIAFEPKKTDAESKKPTKVKIAVWGEFAENTEFFKELGLEKSTPEFGRLIDKYWRFIKPEKRPYLIKSSKPIEKPVVFNVYEVDSNLLPILDKKFDCPRIIQRVTLPIAIKNTTTQVMTYAITTKEVMERFKDKTTWLAINSNNGLKLTSQGPALVRF